MQENELNHAGTKGMHWGDRNYQNADGTWTQLGLERRRAREGGGSGEKKENYFAKKKRIRAEKAEIKKAAKAEKKAEKKAVKEAAEQETFEQRRERILKSTDPVELYKNRDVMTTAEINERINRLNTEAKLGELAEASKMTGLKYADKFLAYGRKANEIYEFTQKPVCKAVAKHLGFKVESPIKKTNYEESLSAINSLSNEAVKALAERTKNEAAVRKFVEDERRRREQDD